MSWDSVPWMVGGGAEHSPEVARLLAFAAFGGREGVVAPGDLVVKELATPGGSVTVDPGACSIVCRATGQNYQAYAGRLPSQDTVSIAPTDSSGGRSDMIVARVEDPNLAGEPWAAPSDPTVGPYIFTRVESDVPSTATTVEELNLGYTAIPLARIDLPASTGTVTQSMIADLRQLVAPRRDSVVKVHNQTAQGNTLTDSTFVRWPLQANWDVDIPEWAVKAQIIGTMAGYKIVEPSGGGGGNVWGDFRAKLGSLTTQATTYNYSQAAGFGKTDAGASAIGDTLSIPASMRGTTQTLELQARRRGGTTGCNLESDDGQVTNFHIVFYEAPDQQ